MDDRINVKWGTISARQSAAVYFRDYNALLVTSYDFCRQTHAMLYKGIETKGKKQQEVKVIW